MTGRDPNGFTARHHFRADRLAKCENCERVAEASWPAKWLLTHEGFVCPSCYRFPPREPVPEQLA